MPPWRRVVVVLLSLLAAVACAPIRSAISVGPDGMRTFSWTTSINGSPLLCTASAAIEPVTGTLAGRSGEREPIWLVAADGSSLSIIWPAGFTARFEPDPALVDDRGRVVARAGDSVRLGQVAAPVHRGTYEDPYIAEGLVFEGCYHFLP